MTIIEPNDPNDLPIIAGTKAAQLLGLSYSSIVALARLGYRRGRRD